MRLKFPYSNYKGLKVPLIPIQIQGKESWHWTWAYVDSGATYSIFHSDVAQRLGLDLSGGRKLTAIVGDGKTISVSLQKLCINLGGKKFHAAIGFSSGLRVGFNLIGREDFFEIFRVCFSDKYREVTFSEMKS